MVALRSLQVTLGEIRKVLGSLEGSRARRALLNRNRLGRNRTEKRTVFCQSSGSDPVAPVAPRLKKVEWETAPHPGAHGGGYKAQVASVERSLR